MGKRRAASIREEEGGLSGKRTDGGPSIHQPTVIMQMEAQSPPAALTDTAVSGGTKRGAGGLGRWAASTSWAGYPLYGMQSELFCSAPSVCVH